MWTSKSPTKTSESCARLLLLHRRWTSHPRFQLYSSREPVTVPDYVKRGSTYSRLGSPICSSPSIQLCSWDSQPGSDHHSTSKQNRLTPCGCHWYSELGRLRPCRASRLSCQEGNIPETGVYTRRELSKHSHCHLDDQSIVLCRASSYSQLTNRSASTTAAKNISSAVQTLKGI